MAVPTIAASGAAVENASSADLDVPYPASPGSGDLLILLCSVSDNVEWSTPSGWAVVGSSVDAATTMVFSKIATGSESGTLAISNASSESKIARMHRSDDADSARVSTLSDDNTKTVGHPDIVTFGVDRLAMVAGGVDDNETASSYTGETGGDLTLHSQDNTSLGTDHLLYLQTASLAAAGVITGGTWTFGGATENTAHVAFYIWVNSTNPEPRTPVVLTLVNDQNLDQIGPDWAVACDNNVYVVESAGLPGLIVSKADPNGGFVFTEQDSGNSPDASNSMFYVAGFLDGANFHITSVDGSNEVFYYLFDCSTDTWQNVDGSNKFKLIRTVGSSTVRHSTIAVRSDGDVIICHGFDSQAIEYARNEGGSWTLGTSVSATASIGECAVVIGPSGQAFFGYMTAANTFRVRALSSGNTLRTERTFTTAVALSHVKKGITWTRSGTDKIGFEVQDSAGNNKVLIQFTDFSDDTNPTITDATSDSNALANADLQTGLLANTNAANQDLFQVVLDDTTNDVDIRTDQGTGSWADESVGEILGTIGTVSATYLEYDSEAFIGFVYQRGDSNYYTEYSLGSISGGDTFEESIALNAAYDLAVVADRTHGLAIAIDSAYSMGIAHDYIAEPSINLDAAYSLAPVAATVMETSVALDVAYSAEFVAALTFEDSILLDHALSLAVIGEVSKEVSIALDAAYSLALAATTTLEESIALDLSYSIDVVATTLLEQSIQLDVAYGIEPVAVTVMEQSIELDVAYSVAVTGIVSKEVSILLDTAYSISPVATTTLEEALALDVGYSIDVVALMVMEESFELVVAYSLEPVAATVMEQSIVLDSAYSISITQTGDTEISILLDVGYSIGVLENISKEVSILLDAAYSIEPATNIFWEPSIALDTAYSVSVLGSISSQDSIVLNSAYSLDVTEVVSKEIAILLDAGYSFGLNASTVLDESILLASAYSLSPEINLSLDESIALNSSYSIDVVGGLARDVEITLSLGYSIGVVDELIPGGAAVFEFKIYQRRRRH